MELLYQEMCFCLEWKPLLSSSESFQFEYLVILQKRFVQLLQALIIREAMLKYVNVILPVRINASVVF